MILYIDTSDKEEVIISIRNNKGFESKVKFKAHRRQSEKLLLAIDSLSRDNGLKLKDLKSIEVVEGGSSFTALRIGVLTANALSYALNIPVKPVNNKNNIIINKRVKVVSPVYDRPPNIS